MTTRAEKLAVLADAAEELGLADVAEMLRTQRVWITDHDQAKSEWCAMAVLTSKQEAIQHAKTVWALWARPHENRTLAESADGVWLGGLYDFRVRSVSLYLEGDIGPPSITYTAAPRDTP